MKELDDVVRSYDEDVRDAYAAIVVFEFVMMSPRVLAMSSFVSLMFAFCRGCRKLFWNHIEIISSSNKSYHFPIVRVRVRARDDVLVA